MAKHSISIIILFLGFFCGKCFAQKDVHVDDTSRFVKYNRNIAGPFTTVKHQLLFSSNYTIDFDYDEEDANPGNISRGNNYGLGLGYNYVFQVYDSRVSGALGAKAEWYPQYYWKFNIVAETDLALIPFGNSNVVIFSGFEPNITFSADFSKKETHFILYFAEINTGNIEMKYGMQIWEKTFLPVIFLDNTLHVFKLSYKMDI